MRHAYSSKAIESSKPGEFSRQGEFSRDVIEALHGAVVVEFGTAWCGHCQRAKPLLASVLARHPDVHHIKIEDGRGRRLGRMFSVKLWPTLIFLRDGKEIARLVRPADIGTLEKCFSEVRGAQFAGHEVLTS